MGPYIPPRTASVIDAKRQIAKKWSKMTGMQPPVGLSDILAMLTGPDLLPDLENLIEIVKKEDENA